MVKVPPVDLSEQLLDIAGQEIMATDKVTLRLCALVCYRVINAHKTPAVYKAMAGSKRSA